MLGAMPLASFSNSALVITVLQSDGEALVAVEAGLAAPVFATAAFGAAGQTPFTVSTGASGGTAAAVSGGAAAFGVTTVPGPCAPGPGGGAVPGEACPQATVPNKTPHSQLLRISRFLQN